MLRTVIFWIFMAPHTIVFAIPIALSPLFDRSGRLAHRLIAIWARTLLYVAGAEVSIEGEEKVNRNEPRIYVCNHQSYFDVFALMTWLPGNARFVAKKSLEYIPFFGQAMRAVGTVILDRKKPEKARKTLRKGCDKTFGQCIGVIIFPEGTRSRDGNLLEFKMGGFVMAIDAQIPVIPVAITGSRDVLPANGFRVSPGNIRVRIGEPIGTAGMAMDDRRELADKTRARIQALLDDMRTGKTARLDEKPGKMEIEAEEKAKIST